MKAMTTRIMMPRHRTNVAMKTLMGKKHRMMKNHNVHVITHHGKAMLGRKGRKACRLYFGMNCFPAIHNQGIREGR